MSTSLTQNQANQFDPNRFKRLFAQYRARVYEASHTAISKSAVTIRNEIQALSNKPTILVVEDNPDDWFLIRFALLRQFSQADCIWLADADQVIRYADQCTQPENERPQLILLDLYLPNVQTGLQVLQSLKAHPVLQSIPTVVLSRSAASTDIAQVFIHSANAYLIKPSEPSEWQTVFADLAPYWHQARGSK